MSYQTRDDRDAEFYASAVPAAPLPADRYLEAAWARGRYGFFPSDYMRKYPNGYAHVIELARMIEKYEPIPEPVDPDLLIAREAAARILEEDEKYETARVFRKGEFDEFLKNEVAAIKLARERGVM